MRRLVIFAVAIVLLIGGLLLLVPVLLPKEAVKTRIAEQISAWTGREIAVRGEPVISAFPGIRVRIDGIVIAGPQTMRNADLAQMQTMTGTVRLLPLLIGDIEFTNFEMIRPQIRLVRDENDKRNWLFDSSVAAMQLAFTGDVPLGAFKIVEGTIDFEDRLAGRRERIEAVNVDIDWRSVSRPLAVSGRARWRGERISIAAEGRDPVSFIKGRQTPFTARLEAASLTIDFNGTAMGMKNTRLGGRLELSSPSSRDLLSWLGNPLADGAAPAALSISGQAAADDNKLDISEARLSLGGNAANGGLRIGFGERPAISGTLAFRSLDLSDYLAGLGSLRTSPDWKGEAVDPNWLRRVDADIRLSAGSIKAGRLSLGESAAAILIENGVLETGIAQASFYGGALTGRLALVDRDDGASAQAQLRASGFSLEQAGHLLGFDQALAGRSSLSVDLSTAGATFGDLIANLDGTVTINAAGGALPGFGLDALAASMRAGVPLSGDGPVSGSRPAMAYRSMDASLKFADQAAQLNNARLETDDFSVDLNGMIALKNGAIDLAGTMALPDTGGPLQPFQVGGTILKPQLQLSEGN